MSNYPLISVIVPVYNTENYLDQCLSSLLCQTLDNIEIIVINDGSTDNSLCKINEYIVTNDKIKLINKKNSGLGDTYNVGIMKAKGKYIAFVESDDFIDKEMLSILYKNAKFNNYPDMVKSTYYEFKNDTLLIKNKFKEFTSFGLLQKDPKTLPSIYLGHPSHWSAIYRKDFIINNNIVFNKSPGAAFQDSGFSFSVYCHLKTFVIIDKPLYYYRLDNNSSSTNYNPIKSFKLNISERLYIVSLFKNSGIDNSFKHIESYKVLKSTKHYLRLLFNKNINLSEIYELLFEARDLFLFYRGYTKALFSFYDKIQFYLILHAPFFYCVIARLNHKINIFKK